MKNHMILEKGLNYRIGSRIYKLVGRWSGENYVFAIVDDFSISPAHNYDVEIFTWEEVVEFIDSEYLELFMKAYIDD